VSQLHGSPMKAERAAGQQAETVAENLGTLRSVFGQLGFRKLFFRDRDRF
jgi:hypothetical protein